MASLSSLSAAQEAKVLQLLNNISLGETSYKLKDNAFAQWLLQDKEGQQLVQQVATVRKRLPGRRFRTLDQAIEVNGVTAEQMMQIATDFCKEADDAFGAHLRQLLPKNWTVEHWGYDLSGEKEAFKQLVNNESSLRDFVAQKVLAIVKERQGQYTIGRLAAQLLKFVPVEKVEDRTIAAYRFGLWWYSFDADNWFALDQMLGLTDAYFNHYDRRGLELRLFKGFLNGGTLAQSVTPNELPVVLNHAECKVTIWAASLND